MKELKKFDVLSVGKIFGSLGFVLSLLEMVVFRAISSNSDVALQFGISASDFTLKLMFLGVLSAAAIYFVSGVILALIYNFIARHFGGVKFDSKDVKASVKKKSKKKK